MFSERNCFRERPAQHVDHHRWASLWVSRNRDQISGRLVQCQRASCGWCLHAARTHPAGGVGSGANPASGRRWSGRDAGSPSNGHAGWIVLSLGYGWIRENSQGVWRIAKDASVRVYRRPRFSNTGYLGNGGIPPRGRFGISALWGGQGPVGRNHGRLRDTPSGALFQRKPHGGGYESQSRDL